MYPSVAVYAGQEIKNKLTSMSSQMKTENKEGLLKIIRHIKKKNSDNCKDLNYIFCI